MPNLKLLNEKVNISENNLRDKMPSVFNILLIDRTKTTKRCIKNIIWANENYIKYDAKKYTRLEIMTLGFVSVLLHFVFLF